MTIDVRPLPEDALAEADRILRVAFDTFTGADVFGDADVLRTRFRSPATEVLGAWSGDQLVGSAVVSRWGSVGVLGPVSVAPERWGAGIGTRLVAAAVEVMEGWDTAQQGLFTFAESPRHHGLYQRFGFWPRYLIAIMSRAVDASGPELGTLLSTLPQSEWDAVLTGCATTTDAICSGLDLSAEMRAVLEQELGDVVVVGEPCAPRGFAVCHVGPGTEAGSGTCYVKTAAVTPGRGAPGAFAALLGACHSFAARSRATRLVVGVNTGRRQAYQALLDAGFRIDRSGVAMHRPDEAGYDRPDVWVLDDWR